MALLKECTLDNGKSGNYWRVTSVTLNGVSARLKVALYVSQEERVAKKGFIYERLYCLFGDSNPLTMASEYPVREIYDSLKTLPEFEGATDA